MERKKRKITVFGVFNLTWMLLMAVFCLIPLLLMISGSLSDDATLQTYGYTLFPKKATFEAYRIVFNDVTPIVRAYGVSILVTFSGTILSLLFTSMIAFPLSRDDFAFKKPVTALILVTMLFSPGLVPTYILITQFLGWKNNLLALIVPGIGGAFYVILLRTFFSDIPKEISESAKIDGCSNFAIFIKMILPLSKPALATCAVLFALNYWNDWYSSFLYIRDKELYSVQHLMQNLATEAKNWKLNASLSANVESADSVVMATCLIGSVPVMVVFMFLQKYIVKGMTVGAVKG